MRSEHVNSFLIAAMNVIETMCQVRPSLGQLSMQTIQFEEGPIWLQIQVIGDMEGKVVYSFPHAVALKLVSSMMGGYVITELDEMGQSAISELGNMISGNASVILSEMGVSIDITTPQLVSFTSGAQQLKALSVPLLVDGIGELNIHVSMISKAV